jgi:hypothetical protein
MTLLDILTDVLYIQTVTKYSDAMASILQIVLVLPFLVLLVGSFWMAIRARGNICVKILYFLKAIVASFTGNIHILSQLEEHSYDTNREKYINGLVFAILLNIPMLSLQIINSVLIGNEIKIIQVLSPMITGFMIAIRPVNLIKS